MFATVGYDQRSVLQAVREATGGVPLSGYWAEGTISGDEADESNFSVVVMVISSEELRWTNGLARRLSTDSRAAGQQVAQDLWSDLGADAVGLFVFPDGTTVNFDHLFAGLEGNLPSDRFLPIWGGGAGDTSRWSKPISTAMTRSCPMGSPTPCSRVRPSQSQSSVSAMSRSVANGR